MRILFAQPGLHRVARGAEAAFEALAVELCRRPGDSVVLFGSGRPRRDRPYDYRHIGVLPRDRARGWPSLPFLRSPYMVEDLTFAPGVARAVRQIDFDVSLTADFPYTTRALRTRRAGRRRPVVFVTQNGDWGPQRQGPEARLFTCDGLVCTNPMFYERNRERWPSCLIPNGVDTARFAPGPSARRALGLPDDMALVLMVSALSGSKRVDAGIRAVAQLPDTGLVVAGSGEDRESIEALAGELLPGRYFNVELTHDAMPSLYRSVDAFMHLSLFESFGNVYIEALSTGLPIVAHSNDVTRWILGDHAQLIDTADADALADALAKALADPGPAEPRVQAAERFSWPAIAGEYRQFLAGIASVSG